MIILYKLKLERSRLCNKRKEIDKIEARSPGEHGLLRFVSDLSLITSDHGGLVFFDLVHYFPKLALYHRGVPLYRKKLIL